MINGKKWFAFFSHTGTEILNISKDLGIAPDCIITNRAPGDINKELTKLSVVQYTRPNPGSGEYETHLSDCRGKCICTLHGWMRIVPERVCTQYEMYNLHPGLITEYPELKGKDPQARVSEDHSHIGLVIHKVDPGVDSGEVILESSTPNVYSGTETITKTLHDMARYAWGDFFRQYLQLEDNKQ